MREFESVALAVDLPEPGLVKGDRGVIVDVLKDGEAYIVEFMTVQGNTVAIEILKPEQLQEIGGGDMPAVRKTDWAFEPF